MFPYQTSDDSAMLKMWQFAHDQSRAYEQAYFDWQYKTNPAGHAIIWLAKQDKEVLGQYVLLPIKFKLAEREGLGSLSVNTLTHPRQRGKGIFILLAEQAYDSCRKKGIDFTFGGPNSFSYNGFVRRLGFTDIGRLALMVKMTGFSRVVAAKLKGQWLLPFLTFLAKLFFIGLPMRYASDFSVKIASDINEKFDQLWDKCKDQHRNIGIRDSRYLSWRYQNKPTGKYTIFIAEKSEELFGYIVVTEAFKPEGTMGVIVDILTTSDKVDQLLVKKAIDHFKKLQIDLMISLVIKGSRSDKVFKRFGFKSCPERFKTNPFSVIVKAHNDELDNNELYDINTWYLTFGDFDVY